MKPVDPEMLRAVRLSRLSGVWRGVVIINAMKHGSPFVFAKGRLDGTEGVTEFDEALRTAYKRAEAEATRPRLHVVTS